MKKILVTGATGYLGRHVVEILLQRGLEVVATASAKKDAVKMPWFQNVAFLPLDINGFNKDENLYKYFNKPDAMIHLAWGNLDDFKSEIHVDKHLPNHYAFLSQLSGEGLKDITVTGTCLEYGLQEGCLQENLPTKPVVPYAEAKNELRKSLQRLQPIQISSLKWLRLFYMYGEGQQSKSLISQLDKAIALGEDCFNMSGGEQERDFLPVKEMAALIVAIGLQENVSDIINCCSGKPVMVKDFVTNYLAQQNQTIKLNLGYYPYPDYEPMRFWGSNKKLKKYLENDESNRGISAGV
jgi:nucleoside-diphosphate-sugar epimerase